MKNAISKPASDIGRIRIDPNTAPKTEHRDTIGTSLKDARADLEVLHKSIAELESALEPVLSPRPAVASHPDEGKPNQCGLSPLRDSLLDLSESIRAVTRKVNSLCHAIDL